MAATSRSHDSASSNPPAKAKPSIAPMSGFSAPFWMNVIIGPMSSPRENAFRSMPAQKPLPAPVRTPAVNPSSPLSRSIAAHSPCDNAPLIAFIASGRFRVINSTRPRCSVSTASATGSGCSLVSLMPNTAWLHAARSNRSLWKKRSKAPADHPPGSRRRNVALARATSKPSARTNDCAKHSVPPVLTNVVSTCSHWPSRRDAQVVDGQADRQQAGALRQAHTARQPHRVVGQRSNQPAVGDAATVGMGGPEPQADVHRAVSRQ